MPIPFSFVKCYNTNWENFSSVNIGKIRKGFGKWSMDFMGKKLEDIVVTLPYQDGTSVVCWVYSYFEVNHKKYFALLPLKEEKQLDFSKSFMLYEVVEDEEDNPIVMYIEDDIEYSIAAQYFSNLLSKK